MSQIIPLKNILRYWPWLQLALFLLVVTGVSLFVIRPLVGSIRREADAIQEAKLAKEIRDEKLSQLDAMQSDAQQYLGKAGEMNSILKSDQEVDFLRQLEALADETKNRITIQVDEPSKAVASAKQDVPEILQDMNYRKYILLEVESAGSYQSTLDFIHKLENLPYYSSIIYMSLNKIEAAETVDNNPFLNSANPGTAKAAPQGAYVKTSLKLMVYIQ